MSFFGISEFADLVLTLWEKRLHLEMHFTLQIQQADHCDEQTEIGPRSDLRCVCKVNQSVPLFPLPKIGKQNRQGQQLQSLGIDGEVQGF
jgi:hypothetical protein